VEEESGRVRAVTVKPAERRAGVMCLPRLPEAWGMLVVYERVEVIDVYGWDTDPDDGYVLDGGHDV
jgi:hypothetical protein